MAPKGKVLQIIIEAWYLLAQVAVLRVHLNRFPENPECATSYKLVVGFLKNSFEVFFKATPVIIKRK